MAKLSIGKRIGQFDAVPFVNDMTNHQLKVCVKTLWLNMQEIACVCDDVGASGVGKAIDSVLDGESWSKVDLRKSLE